MTGPRSESLALALSGGGVRAMAFHAGVLSYLAEQGQLEKVAQLSTVSGGSLFAGLVFRLADWQWPTSAQYTDAVLPAIRTHMTHISLQKQGIRAFLWPGNWRFAFRRAALLARLLKKNWGIDHTMGELPHEPAWALNGTSSESGVRFEFRQDWCGDYVIGYSAAESFHLADAMAMSAAFPVGIGPLKLDTTKRQWHRPTRRDQPRDEWPRHQPEFRSLHLYDGGVYDNLGTEPLFDIGRQQPKARGRGRRILVCDAGAPLQAQRAAPAISPARIARILDIATAQTRALRVRAFSNYLVDGGDGAYLQIGSWAPARIRRYEKGNEERAEKLLKRDWLSESQVRHAASIATSLDRMRPETFDLLVRHGYETALWSDQLFG